MHILFVGFDCENEEEECKRLGAALASQLYCVHGVFIKTGLNPWMWGRLCERDNDFAGIFYCYQGVITTYKVRSEAFVSFDAWRLLVLEEDLRRLNNSYNSSLVMTDTSCEDLEVESHVTTRLPNGSWRDEYFVGGTLICAGVGKTLLSAHGACEKWRGFGVDFRLKTDSVRLVGTKVRERQDHSYEMTFVVVNVPVENGHLIEKGHSCPGCPDYYIFEVRNQDAQKLMVEMFRILERLASKKI